MYVSACVSILQSDRMQLPTMAAIAAIAKEDHHIVTIPPGAKFL